MTGEVYRDDLIDNYNGYASDGVELSCLACELGQRQESENLIEPIQHVDL
jgi:hypothetical protein